MPYSDDDMLMLSGIQHFVFCPRQWALICMDQQWDDNYLTIEGTYLHRNVDNPEYRLKVNNTLMLRQMHISSSHLGVYGIADVVELHTTDDLQNSIEHPKYGGRYIPYPVEYKHGKPKPDDCDVMQLVAQVMCIEERYHVVIPEAALFYWKTRHRLAVEITDPLREDAKRYCDEMHRLFKSSKLPMPPAERSRCQRCSLLEACMPDVQADKNASDYISRNLYEKVT